MANALLYNATIATSSDPGPVSIVISEGLVVSINGTGAGVGNAEDCSGLTLFPGFIDVHIHGAVGVDVNTADVEGLCEVAKFLATKGVTGWVPTLVPDSDETYAKVISAIDRLFDMQTDMPIAQALGVHYEGVFANAKMC